MKQIEIIMRTAPVIPVLVIEDLDHARPIAEALVAGGLNVLEVTLRTSIAFEAMEIMRQVPGAIVGAGTVINPSQLGSAVDAGAEFIVSPGLTPALGQAAITAGVPFLPGVANAADIMAAGGIPALKSLAAPFHNVKFCPTGGITEASAPDWLALDPVLCVGGSWVVPKGAPDVAAIEAATRKAAGLAR